MYKVFRTFWHGKYYINVPYFKKYNILKNIVSFSIGQCLASGKVLINIHWANESKSLDHTSQTPCFTDRKSKAWNDSTKVTGRKTTMFQISGLPGPPHTYPGECLVFESWWHCQESIQPPSPISPALARICPLFSIVEQTAWRGWESTELEEWSGFWTCFDLPQVTTLP